MRKLEQIKKYAVMAILPRWEHVNEGCYATVSAFPMSYSVGRSIIEFCAEMKITPGESRVLIVGAHGGRDYHWLTGFGFQVDVLDLGDHEWGKSKYVGDACLAETWQEIDHRYDLIVMHDVLEHLPEDFAALRHAKTVLKSNGFLFLSVPFKHDPEITHVRSYSEATLIRLLALAGYDSVWKRDRPGLLEAFPTVVNALNYGLALLMPSPQLGGRLLNRLMGAEYFINNRTRKLYRMFGRSPQKGITLAALPTAHESVRSHVDINKEMFIPGPSALNSLAGLKGTSS
ncbi:MAG TPA: class I SAM-dependent methyltransferase [Pyrinomonadaceae bacterium]|nr:class I SAM-dependent methyltransferase [Pyrinomonadaceae bacterium]